MSLQKSFVVICMYLGVSLSLARSSPCDNSYWADLRDVVGANIVSSENPLVGDIPYATYTPRPNNLFHIDGHLLMRTSQESEGDDVFDELVFLRGIGEYYEFSWNVIKDNQYATAMDSVSKSGFNMIRQFVYSGFYDAPGWIYPFTKINNKFALHKYDESYFSKLDQLIEAAENEGITVLLTLFDFAEDIQSVMPTPTPEDGTPTPTPSTDFLGAWNPLCNYYEYNGNPDYSFPISYTYSDVSTEFFEIYQETPTLPGTSTPELNFLGKTQRDYVLKVVRETRHHPNVIYEIANEPKSNDIEVSIWANQVSQWIKWGTGEGCGGCYEAVVSITEADVADPAAYSAWNPYNPANNGLLTSGGIDIFSRHNCYHGAKTNISFQTSVPTPNWTTTPTPTQLPQPFNSDSETVHMWQEGAMLYSDFYYWLANSPSYPKAFIVDTDGAHRGSPYNVNPQYRDSDIECQNWANIAQIMGAGFNTKDSIHTSLDYGELDATTSVTGNFAIAVGPFWDGSSVDIDSIPANNPSSGCDDFWWESTDFYEGLPVPINTPNAVLNFDGIDVPLGHSLTGDYFNPTNPLDPIPFTPLPSKINYKPKVRWVAYGENSVSTTEDVCFIVCGAICTGLVEEMN